MNLQRLEEVRGNLDRLVSLANVLGPQDLTNAVQTQLGEIEAVRLVVFEAPLVQKPAPTVQSKPKYDFSGIVPSAVAKVRALLAGIAAFRLSFVVVPKVEKPKPEAEKPYVDSQPVRHNHPTRDIKKFGQCPACDEYHSTKRVQVRVPEKFEIPVPPGVSRRVSSSTTYNPERYVPYRVLWAKVIIRASYDYALWKDSKDMRLRKFAKEAERWIFESSNDELSFENICFAFDFPVERIRQKTRAMTKEDVKKLEFRERHGRIEQPPEK